MGHGKTVLVTGASRGIGRAIALAFADMGFKVVVNCRKNAGLLADVRLAVEGRGASCLPFVGDVGDFETVSRLFEAAEEFSGGVDVLVNNAGVSHVGLLADMGVDEWDAVVRTNLSSMFYCCKLAIPHMVARKWGKIINISSIWGEVGASCEAAYAAAKGGVDALTKSLAKELGPSNVQVNAIACGLVDTDMNAGLTGEELDAVIDDIPVGRAGTPNEVAQLVSFLADGPPYLTGRVIRMDGAWY